MSSIPLNRELSLFLYILTLYVFEKVCSRVKISPLVGNIIAGVLLGPPLLNVVPFVEFFKVSGLIGAMCLVIDSALQVEVGKVKKLGLRAFFLALTGMVCPVVLSYSAAVSIYSLHWTQAAAIGSAMAPTSFGFSAKLLQEHGQLDTIDGQLICTAAVIDDVLSLLLLSELQALIIGTDSVFAFLKPLIASLASIVIGGALALALHSNMEHISVRLAAHDQPTGFYMLSALSVLFAWASAAVGSSPLLGCFFGALPFSESPRVIAQWNERMKFSVVWLTRIFFGGTIAFSIPPFFPKNAGVAGLFTAQSVSAGFVLCLCAILGKLAVGVYARPFGMRGFFVLGFGMNGRGEFSFLIAQQARASGIFHASGFEYSTVVIALLFTCLITPFIFEWALERQVTAESNEEVALQPVNL